MRKFETYDNTKKIKSLLLAVGMAATGDPVKLKETENFFEVAAENGKLHGLKASDFDCIKHMTIDDLSRLIR